MMTYSNHERYMPRDYEALDLFAEDYPELADYAAEVAADDTPQHFNRTYYGMLRYYAKREK